MPAQPGNQTALGNKGGRKTMREERATREAMASALFDPMPEDLRARKNKVEKLKEAGTGILTGWERFICALADGQQWAISLAIAKLFPTEKNINLNSQKVEETLTVMREIHEIIYVGNLADKKPDSLALPGREPQALGLDGRPTADIRHDSREKAAA